MTIAPESTKGSCENVHKLLSGELDAALVQYDVAAEAFKAGQADADAGDSAIPKGGWMCKLSPEEADKAELRVIAAVSDAAVHVLVRRPVRLDDFAEIGREPLFMGKDGSGSYETAKVILGAAGHTAEQLPLFTGTADEALAAMSRRELLTMLRTTEPGHTEIRDVLASGLATLNPLPEAVLNRLIDGYPYYRICPIETGTYPGLEYSMPTVCVSSVVLVATPRERVEDEAFWPTAGWRSRRWSRGSRSWRATSSTRASRSAWSGAGSPSASRSRCTRWPSCTRPASAGRRGCRAGVRGGAGGGAVPGAPGAAAAASPGRGDREPASNPLVPFAAFACVVTLSTFIVWSLEHDSNARLRTLNDSFWEMNTFATGNFTTETLKTPTARLVGAAATILGLGLLAWFTATLTNIFAQEQTRLWRRLNRHLVVLNFREDMLPLIRLLRSPGPTRHRPLHVVVSDALPRRCGCSWRGSRR
ncbi:TAXI family TRAP transporter solute-binding subunit [Nannocystis pusilla]|uniref:TAXI family TRAP transporter solute-binding subunit n=1 Tax=Nannocystis pusilla TaxID=889268 RepID=UPI003B775518